MRNRGKSLLALAGVTALTLVAAGCTASTPTPSPGDASSGAAQQPAAPGTQQIKRGGTIIYHSSTSYAGADPAMGQNAYQLWQVTGTYMLRRTPDTWELQGDSIEKWDISPDGMEVTLHVRKGVKWQNKPPVNGREVEAKDIVYTLRSITGLQYPDLPPLRFPRKSNLEDMEDAVAVDKYTVKVKMKNPSATFVDGLAEYRGPITPDGIREHFGGRDSLAVPHPDRYLSAGPFILTKFQDTVEAVYERYPDYWEKAEDGQSKPYADVIRNIWIADTGTQNAAFIARQTTLLSVSNQETRNQVATARPDAQMRSYEPQSCWYRIAWNMNRKPFDDVRVRRALSLTLDPVETGKTLWGEFQGKPVWRYPGNLPYTFPEAMTQEELSKLQHYESPKSQATIDEAKRLMAEAGLAGGFEFEMMSSASTDASQLYSSQINKVFPNIKIKLVGLDNAIQLERAAKQDFDAQAYCYIHEPTAVAMMKTVYHSKGGRNTAGLKDAKMDELLDQAGRETDVAKRKALLREAQMRTFEVNSIMATTHYVAFMALQPELRGVRLGSSTHYNMFAKEWWLDK